MKKIMSIFNPFFVAGLMAVLLFSSCLKDECDEIRVFIEYTPVYVQPEQFRIPVETQSPREMIETGKIYFYNDMIFINEKYEGVHIIDNSDPFNPVVTAFMSIPGNVDIAIQGNLMYADSYVDLLTIDISNINSPEVLSRDEEVFKLYEHHQNLGYFIYSRATERKLEVECADPNFGDDVFWRGGGIFVLEDAIDVAVPSGNAGAVSPTGVGGSFARFALRFGHLYVLNNNELVAYSLSTPETPVKTETTYVTWGNIETLFSYKNYLFIGSSNGMYIYDASEPSTPSYVSEFRHATACDPVFVKDDIAYVTLRDGTRCESFTNQLDVLDVSNVFNPVLIASYEMDNPHGLSVTDDHLYLCEGDFGLKVFETKDLTKIDQNRIEHLSNISAVDAISLSNEHLLIIGKDGLYQFDSSDPGDLDEISFISVTK
ncbi:MAG: hypothetical protein KJO50_04850 [Bacteroidia bacterium]|nr:hypothetical protein [Bacteroidia bacterium]